MRFFTVLFLLFFSVIANSQTLTKSDSLAFAIQNLELEVRKLDLRMQESRNRFQAGILVSTIGYSVTIAGGLMLGRENDKLGQGLLVAGGLTGLTGTYLLMDAFNFLSGRKKKP